jgi:hypothetical protein
MTELDSMNDLRTLLVDRNGWTLLTAMSDAVLAAAQPVRHDDPDVKGNPQQEWATITAPCCRSDWPHHLFRLR